MKNIATLIVCICSFYGSIFSQTEDNRFRLKIITPGYLPDSLSLHNKIKNDKGLSEIFLIDEIRLDSINHTIIEIYAPDGFRMGTCHFSSLSPSPIPSGYLVEVESSVRDRWNKINKLDSYKRLKPKASRI